VARRQCVNITNFHFQTLSSTPCYRMYFIHVHPLLWRWIIITIQNNWQNLMLVLITELLPGMPHVYKTIFGEYKTFSTKLITVNFSQIDFAVNLQTVA
jgi:hypothetical protein